MKKAYIYTESKKINVKTVDINALEWFDRINGNSYFSAKVTVNFGLDTEKSLNLPFQYGYGDHYKDMVLNELKDKFKLNSEIDRIWLLKDYDVIVRSNKFENCKKRELKEFC